MFCVFYVNYLILSDFEVYYVVLSDLCKEIWRDDGFFWMKIPSNHWNDILSFKFFIDAYIVKKTHIILSSERSSPYEN